MLKLADGLGKRGSGGTWHLIGRAGQLFDARWWIAWLPMVSACASKVRKGRSGRSDAARQCACRSDLGQLRHADRDGAPLGQTAASAKPRTIVWNGAGGCVIVSQDRQLNFSRTNAPSGPAARCSRLPTADVWRAANGEPENDMHFRSVANVRGA
jgi:hypothetical protein